MGAVDRWLWALQGLYRPAGGLGADWGPYKNSMGPRGLGGGGDFGVYERLTGDPIGVLWG